MMTDWAKPHSDSGVWACRALLLLRLRPPRCLIDGPLLGASAQSYRVSTGTPGNRPKGMRPPS